MGPTWLEERIETSVFWELDMSGSSVVNFPHAISVMQAGNWRARAEAKTALWWDSTEEITSGSVGRGGNLMFRIPKVSNDA